MARIKIPLFLQIVAALIFGIAFGYSFPEATKYSDWAGKLFINSLKMVVIPLVASSIISGISNISVSGSLKKLSFATFGYYLLTSLLAIITGLFFSNILLRQPIEINKAAASSEILQNAEVSTDIYTTVLNIIPSNVFESASKGQMLPIIFFCIVFGIFTLKTGGKHKKVINDFANASFEVLMKITLFIIKLTPFGVFAIVASKIAAEPDIGELFLLLGRYAITVLSALVFHSFISLPALTYFTAKRNPFVFMKQMATPLITAFSTSSSSATLPITMETASDKADIDKRVTGFTMPLGATINMDGTALYECVAVMFIANISGIELGFAEQLTIVLTALLVSIGAAGIPMAGLFMMTVILNAVNLPIEAIAFILPIDRPLDMLRTAVNVWSDSCGAACVEKVAALGKTTDAPSGETA